MNSPDWAENSHCLAVTIRSLSQHRQYHIIMNSYWEPLEFELPAWTSMSSWWRLLDTSLDAPNEISKRESAPPVVGTTYVAQPHSMVVLISE